MGEYGAKNTTTRPANRKCKQLDFGGLLMFVAKIQANLKKWENKSNILSPYSVRIRLKMMWLILCYNPCILPYLYVPALLSGASVAVVCCVQCIPAGFLTVNKWVTLIMFCVICMLIHINPAISRRT